MKSTCFRMYSLRNCIHIYLDFFFPVGGEALRAPWKSFGHLKGYSNQRGLYPFMESPITVDQEQWPSDLMVLVIPLSCLHVVVNRFSCTANTFTYQPIASVPIFQIFLIDAVVYGCRTCVSVPNVFYYDFYFW